MKQLMLLSNNKIKLFEYAIYLISFSLFFFFFGETLNYGRTYDDFALVDRVIKSPGDAKLISSFLYAKFHFYPIYFLSHELDNFLTFLVNFNNFEISNAKIAKFTNMFLHVTNSFLVYLFLKKILKIENELKDNIFAYLASLIFLFHPITSQIIFNITTRNESLALFFGLLTFIYCIGHTYEKKIINYFFISLLFFFSLCSKLTTVYLAGLIPLTIFLLNFHSVNLKENFKRNFDIFVLLAITFFIYYYLRNIFTEENNLNFFSDLYKFIFYFLTSLKFYLIGLFFPYEHIYVNAENYNIFSSVILFSVFIIFGFISFYFFWIKKDPILLISFFWICASLFLPILFGVIEYGFPLISNLAERYQYSSVVAVSIIFIWFFKNLTKKKYLNVFISGFYSLILFFCIFILVDRSLVYKNNFIFMDQIDENSPKNVHRYAFTLNIKNSILVDDMKSYIFNLYQFYQLDTSFEKAILEFLRFYIYEKNEKGIDFFENEFTKNFEDDPPRKFTLARFYTVHEEYKKAQSVLKEIFDHYDDLEVRMKKENKRVTFLDPPLDDLYFELGKVHFYMDEKEKALEYFKTANVINPMHATALYNAAITLKKMGLIEDASKLYLDAIEINPFLRETSNNILASSIQNNNE
ncbi:hypothetical protein [Candidatus Pelagibacter sp.]|uniref:tetratricopeptide repeat protein n=1 Tax=Candidatus Pelagibacter sp. TaxID=2024849 RepID=UPI003F852E24